MKRLITWFALLTALGLAGCGFRPLYGETTTSAAVTAALESVSVDPIRSLVGAELRNYLIDRLTPTGQSASARYRLAINIGETRVGGGVRLDASVTRYSYRLTAKYQLIDAQNGDVIYAGTSFSDVPYDVVESQFATVYAQFDAESRAAETISEDIKIRLALFFDSQRTETAQLTPSPSS